MPYQVTVDRAARTIRVYGHGRGETAETLRLIADLEQTLLGCNGYDFLYDALDLSIASSPADMMTVATALFGGAGAGFRRIAIVVPPARVTLARIFTALADRHGVAANVFTDVDSAREWLASPEG